MTPIMLDNRSRTTPGSATLRHRALPALYVTSVCRSMPARRGVARGGQGASAPPQRKEDRFFSVLAGSGSARHGTVCPPKPKILATPLARHITSPATGLRL